MGRVGVWLRPDQATPEAAQLVESLGYGALWLGGSPPGDLGHVRRLLDATTMLPIATGIINVWASPAAQVATAYQDLPEADRQRLVLGIGIGHREATAEYRSPFETLAAYVEDLRGTGVPQEALALAALGPRVLRLAKERTAGAHPYLTTPDHTRMAREILGEGPLLAPEQKVLLDADPASAREQAGPVIGFYLKMNNYTRNLKRIGFTDEDIEAPSDRLLDALVLHGDEQQIAAGVRAHLDAGADHVCIQPLGQNISDELTRLAGVLPLSGRNT